MRIRTLLPFAIAFALGPLAGCATVLNGSRQTIHVETDPPGATVTVAGERHTSPVDLVLPRKAEDLEVVVEKEGYVAKRIPLVRKTSGNTWLNFVGIPVGAAAGGSIGASSGSGFNQFDNGATGVLIGAAAVTGLGFAVDAGTGAIHRFDPPAIAVRLDPVVPVAAASSTP